ncbi:MAG: ABC transporter permease [Planctomycetes bacterium]|nr:ABC transporter permease [Planctomycetota bacterium]
MIAITREYFERRRLIWVLTQRALIARYRGTVLGFLWTFLHPLLLLLVYSLVFGTFVRIEVERYPAFLFAGLLPWWWFAKTLAISSTSLLADGPWIRQAAFPPSISPLVANLAGSADFLLGVPLLLGVIAWQGAPLGPQLLWLPLLILLQLGFGLGLGLAAAALSVRFRDTVQLIAALTPILFFLTPVIYPPSQVPERFSWLLELNPLTHLIRPYQAVLYHGRAPDPADLGLAALAALVALALGAWIMDRLRDRIPEEL